jgi:5-formyltetrahydrofolate cyclo-ligase
MPRGSKAMPARVPAARGSKRRAMPRGADMAETDADMRERKVELRRHMQRVRAAIAPPQRAVAAEAVAQRLGGLLRGLAPVRVVSGFMAIGEEIDPQPALELARAGGAQVCLPVMSGRDAPLLFRGWRCGDPLVERKWGIREPLETAPMLVPDLLLVPLLAFDLAGNRLGYGGGYYDRTLRAARVARGVLAVGIAYDQQRVDEVPAVDYDEPLDWVLTPSAAIRRPA